MKTSTPLTVTARLLPLLMAILASGGRADVPERLTIDADVRLRYETIDVEGSERTSRDRLRARGGFEYAASDDVDFVFRVATGRGDPVSTNLTLDSDFSVTDLQIDRAYLDWRMGGGLALRLGKMKQPWIRPGGNQLIWDNDLNPEGLALQFASGMFRGSAAELEIDGPPDGDDTRLHALQGAVTASRGEGARVTAGVSYFDYSDARGKVPFFDGKPHGNLVGPDGTFRHGFRLVELFAEMRAAVFGRPVTLFADAVSNTAASDEDRGYSVGAMLGDAAEAGDFQAGYAFIDSEADAVVATFSNSDFAGGNSNSRGHFITATYRLRDNIELGATVIVSERHTGDVPAQDYDRLMLDLEFTFD